MQVSIEAYMYSLSDLFLCIKNVEHCVYFESPEHCFQRQTCTEIIPIIFIIIQTF